MRLLHWDDINPHSVPPGQPYLWSDSNLFFGSDGKGYAREPGDPEFQPYGSPEPPVSQIKSKHQRRTMKRQNYYPTRQADQAVWLENFRLKIALYAATLGISPARLADIVADSRWLVYLLVTWLEAVRTHGKASTTALEQAQTGEGALTLPGFTQPPLPDGVVARPAGALSRIFDLVAEIKDNDACTDPMCIDMGIMGPPEPAPNFNVLRPEITATLTATGVQIGWGWQGWAKYLDQCEIQVDRADGKGWTILTFDTTPGYLDTAPFPATLTKWKYRAIYRVDDAQVGQWSSEASVSVGG